MSGDLTDCATESPRVPTKAEKNRQYRRLRRDKKGSGEVPMNRSRGWIFVINNYTDDDIAFVMDLADDSEYCCVGFEVGKREETPHMQCYIKYKNPRRWEVMHDLLKPNHFEPQKGNDMEAATYSMKESCPDVWEFGDRPRQGKPGDLEVIQMLMRSGYTSNEIAEQYFSRWVYINRSLEKYEKMLSRFDTTLVVYDPDDLYVTDVIRMCYRDAKGLSTDGNGRSIIYLDVYVNWLDITSKYYSGKYEYIIVPVRGLQVPSQYNRINIFGIDRDTECLDDLKKVIPKADDDLTVLNQVSDSKRKSKK